MEVNNCHIFQKHTKELNLKITSENNKEIVTSSDLIVHKILGMYRGRRWNNFQNFKVDICENKKLVQERVRIEQHSLTHMNTKRERERERERECVW